MSDSSPLPTAESEWAAFAAIDWADRKHFWRLVPTGSDQQEEGELENTPEAVETWAAALQERFGGRPIALCLEQSRGALVYMLAKYAHLVIFPALTVMLAVLSFNFIGDALRDYLDPRSRIEAGL